MTDQNPKYLDLGGTEAATLIGTSALLRGTDAGICTTCQLPSATLIKGKCPKHADLQPAEGTSVPDLLGGGNTEEAQQKKGGCWTKR